LAACVNDGAALGELFRHLSNESQIDSFLYAFEDIGKKIVQTTLQVDLDLYRVLAMPPGEEQRKRDQRMREKLAANSGAFTFVDDPDDVMAVHWEVRHPDQAGCSLSSADIAVALVERKRAVRVRC
jgi:hypothetical protein